jgi:hypothetical protein
MARHLHVVGTLSILSGQTDSTDFGAGKGDQAVLGSVSSIVVFAPATLPETVNLQVSPLATPGAAPNDRKVLQWQPGTDLVIAAGKAVNIPLVAGFRSFRLHATGAVAAQRDFVIVFQVDADYEG